MAVSDLGKLRARIAEYYKTNVVGAITAAFGREVHTDVLDTCSQPSDWESKTSPTRIVNKPLIPDPLLPVLADCDAARPASLYLVTGSGQNLPEAGLDAIVLTSAPDARWAQLAHVLESGKSWYRPATRSFTAWGAASDVARPVITTPSDIGADGVYQITAGNWRDRNIDPFQSIVARVGGFYLVVSGSDWYWRRVGADELWSAENHEAPAPRAILAADARYDVHPGEILISPPGTPGNPDANHAYIVAAAATGDALTAYRVTFPFEGDATLEQYEAQGASQSWGSWRLIQPYRLELPTIGPFSWITQNQGQPAAGEMGQLNAGQLYYNGEGSNLSEISEVFEDGSVHLVMLKNASAGKKDVTIIVTDHGSVNLPGDPPRRFVNYSWPDPANGIAAWAAGDQITVQGGSPHLLVSRMVQTWTAATAGVYSIPSTAAVEDRLDARAGKLMKDIAGQGAVALTADEAAHAAIEFTGALTADRVVTLPATPGGPRLVTDATTGNFLVKVKCAGQADAAALRLDTGANLVLHDGAALRWPPPVRGQTDELTVSGSDQVLLSGCQADDWIRIMAWEEAASPSPSDKMVSGSIRFGSITTNGLGWLVENPDGNDQLILVRDGTNLKIRKGGGLTDTVKAIAGFER